jgi:hypothetical protein
MAEVVTTLRELQEASSLARDVRLLSIRNHWNWGDRVILECNGATIGAFNARELIAGIENALRMHK